MSKIPENRNAMKCPNFSRGMKKSDQQMGIAPPPHGKEPSGKLIVLPSFDNIAINDSYAEILEARRSVRVYNPDALMTKSQLAYMLYTAFGITSYTASNVATLRKAPSGGARHAFEIYAVVRNVEGLENGVYHYLPTQNVGEKIVTIEYMGEIEDQDQTLASMLAEQNWSKNAQCTIFISCVPYKAEWRYGEAAHRVVLIDLGHVGQNIMLSATSLGLGSCCVAAFDQKLSDQILQLDGNDEFVVYAITVGVPKSS